jgi:hypothetical protein
MSSLIRCIYSSVASANFREEDLPALLTTARTANAARGVTGMLAYINGNFLQVIEGTEESIDELYTKISADPRHRRISVLVREPITTRSFADWSMGFEALLPADLQTLIGENDFFDSGSCVDALDPGVVKSVLLSFRKAQTETA